MKANRFLKAFGPHLVFDGYGGKPEAVRDLEVIRQFLKDMPDQISMTPITPVVVLPRPDGISGFVIIAESHIVVHTKYEELVAQLDIFSCKDFDTKLATELFCQTFGPFVGTAYQLFDRGIEFPRNVDVVSRMLTGEVNAMRA